MAFEQRVYELLSVLWQYKMIEYRQIKAYIRDEVHIETRYR